MADNMTDTISPTTGRPDSAVDPKWAEGWKGMNPTGTPQQMNEDYFFAKAGKIKPTDLNTPGTAPVPESTNPLRSGFNAVRDVATGGVALALPYATAPLTGIQNAATAMLYGKNAPPPMPGMTPDEAQAGAKLAVPQTPAGAAVLAAPFVGPLARMGWAARTGIGALAGTVGNAATGESPGTGLVEGAFGAALPAGAEKATDLAARAFQKTTRMGVMRDLVDIPWAQRMLQGMREDVPALWNKLTLQPGSAPAKMGAIHNDKIFDAALRPQMDRAENAIAAAVPKIPNPFPEAAAAGASPAILDSAGRPIAGIPPALMARIQAAGGAPRGAASIAPEMIDTADAFKRWHDAATKAAQAYDPRYPGANYQLKEIRKAWEKAITDAAPPHLADVWKAQRAEFGRALKYREYSQAALESAAPNAIGTAFDPKGVVAKYYSDPRRYGPDKLPGFHKHFWGGGEMGVQPTMTDPGLYARMFGPGGVKANIPTPKTLTLPGATYGYPKTASALSNAARAGVVSLGSQTAEP